MELNLIEKMAHQYADIKKEFCFYPTGDTNRTTDWDKINEAFQDGAKSAINKLEAFALINAINDRLEVIAKDENGKYKEYNKKSMAGVLENAKSKLVEIAGITGEDILLTRYGV